MDIDRYLVTNLPGWGRLAQLTGRVTAKPSSLSSDEVREFLALYQRASSQLSFARGHYDNPELTAELTTLVANANAVLYRRTASPTSTIRRFFTIYFPAAVWHLRKVVAVAALATFLPALALGLWLGNDTDSLDRLDSEANQAAYVDEQFEDYYSSEPAAEFATAVLLNNIRVSFTAFGVGIFFGVGSLAILALNGANLGVAWAVFIGAGQQSKFWGLIIPHGLLELSAIVLAGAAGMSVGFAMLAPGDRHRSAALAEEARRAVVVILGLILAFVVAGLIEGFITPGLPAIPRMAIGITVELVFVSYIVAFGRRAEALGFTGLASESLEGPRAQQALSI